MTTKQSVGVEVFYSLEEAVMRHYEIVLLVHPDDTKVRVQDTIDRYKAIITDGGGVIHRFEDWHKLSLAYSIKGVDKAHFFLFNIECDQSVIRLLKDAFLHNDAVLREFLHRRKRAFVDPSPFMRSLEANRSQSSGYHAKKEAKQSQHTPDAEHASSDPNDAHQSTEPEHQKEGGN